MGYYYTTDTENAVPPNSWAMPKTHVPGSPVKERGHRYYMPEAGRWASRDPLWETYERNLFTTCKNRCIDFVDYMGLQPMSGQPLNEMVPETPLTPSVPGSFPSGPTYIGPSGTWDGPFLPGGGNTSGNNPPPNNGGTSYRWCNASTLGTRRFLNTFVQPCACLQGNVSTQICSKYEKCKAVIMTTGPVADPRASTQYYIDPEDDCVPCACDACPVGPRDPVPSLPPVPNGQWIISFGKTP